MKKAIEILKEYGYDNLEALGKCVILAFDGGHTEVAEK
jgi:hypothetical protein